LSRLRRLGGDQLVPFENLWDYTQDLDYYPGTIFRFPLRGAGTKSLLRTNKKHVDCNKVRRLMDLYFDEARISLLFLRRIKSIDFGIYGNSSLEWSITRQPSIDDDAVSFSKHIKCSFSRTMESGERITGTDKWWVAIQDLLPAVDRFQVSSRRVMKNVECGIAALIDSQTNPKSIALKAIQPKIFNTLPLPIPSDLPVHIHATFELSGDRQSIAINEYGNMQAHGSNWNGYILKDPLPKLYLASLDEIGKLVRQHVLDFFPQEEPPKRSCAELLCSSFWEELPKNSFRLFPKAQPTAEHFRRRPAELFDINQAVFDFLLENQSNILAPLLMALGVNLVRHIPAEVSKYLKQLPQVKHVTGEILRPLLKSERSRECLLEEIRKNPLILDVLFPLLIPGDSELEDLDGCYLLPLADGSLTSLKIVDTDDVQSSKYFVASKEELKIFEFASPYLVTSTISKKLQKVLDSGKFNLVNLQLSHVGKLLKMRPDVTNINPETDSWLTQFWNYWKKNIEFSVSPPDITSLDGKIFRATCRGVDIYTTIEEFNKFPAVVEPSISEHRRLCDKIPDLYRFHTKFMPEVLANKEESFHKDAAFYRFIRALRVLANGSGIGNFVKTNLDLTHTKVMCFLIKSAFTSDMNKKAKSF
jgi:sacsin